jgi:N6-adenosine-specific RNA methylase IME4
MSDGIQSVARPNPLPPLSSSEYQALKADIATRGGLHTPIVVDQDTGEIVDGFHRDQACQELGIEPAAATRRFESSAHREAFALAANLTRRQLSPEQRSEVRDAQRRVYLELRLQDCTQEEAAGLVGVPRTTGETWEGESIDDTVNTFPDQRLSVPRIERDAIYERASAGEPYERIAADYKVSRQRVGQIVRLVKAKRSIPQPVAKTPAWPDGPFRCITLDPPWPMPKIQREERPDQGAALDYSTMLVDCGHDEPSEDRDCCIKAIPVDAMADQRGAHVYLWVTHRFLPDGFKLFHAWGVRYQCLMTWRKNVGITPFSWMYDTEHVLFGRVGDLPLLRNGLRLSFDSGVTRHSAKPAEFYERVCEASPGDRLALFERGERPGFMPWGHEVAL